MIWLTGFSMGKWKFDRHCSYDSAQEGVLRYFSLMLR